MAKIKTAELEGAALDWAVAQVAGKEVFIDQGFCSLRISDQWVQPFRPSTDWSRGGPLIEQYQPDFSVMDNPDGSASVEAQMMRDSNQEGFVDVYRAEGDTYLVAAMRVIVAAELGDEVEVPVELAHD